MKNRMPLLLSLTLVSLTNVLFAQTTPVVIGKTTYDLQSNGSSSNRIQVNASGQISVVYSGSLENNTTWSDRGTFYNYYNGTNWASQPVSRIENERTGFPAIVQTKTGKEFIVSHNNSTQLVINTRNTAGTGAWTQQSFLPTGFWPRAVCSSGDTIHMICNGTGASSSFVKYFRSPDGGLTWDINGIMLPGTDSLGGFNYNYSGEPYALDARNNVVAIVVGGYNNKLVLYKSVNSGTSFTAKTIKTFPVPNYTGNAILPYTETTDGSNTVVIGGGDTVHVSFGQMFIIDDNPTDNDFNYYPGTANLEYWNDQMATDNIVSLISPLNSTFYYRYGSRGIITMPSAAYDHQNHKLYIVYSSAINGNRDIFITSSIDNGSNFGPHIQVSNTGAAGMENVFPTIAKSDDNRQHIVWQSMKRQGLATDGSTPVDTAFIMYTKLNIANPVKVTFRVDMRYAGPIDNAGMHIAGDFQSWDPAATAMTNAGSNVYEYETQILPGTTIQYKFINGNTALKAENVPLDCSTLGLNRFAQVPAFDTILPAYIFGDCYTFQQRAFTNISATEKLYYCKSQDSSLKAYFYSGLPFLDSTNTFRLELDTSGGMTFNSPVILASKVSANGSDSIQGLIPSYLRAGDYYIRISSTSPVTENLVYMISIKHNEQGLTYRMTDHNLTVEPLGICSGDNKLLIVTSATQDFINRSWYKNGIGIQWSYLIATNEPLVFVTQQGTYTYVQDNGCTIDSVEVFVPEDIRPAMPIVAVGTNPVCEGGYTTLSVSNPDPGAMYLWYNNSWLPDNASSIVAERSGLYMARAYANLQLNPGCFANSDFAKITVNGGSNKQLKGIAVNNITDTVYMFDIKAVNANNIWGVLRHSLNEYTPVTNKVIRSSNGGASWNSYAINGADSLFPSMIFALDSLTAWVPLYDPINGGSWIYKTTNGGVSWTLQNTAFNVPNGFANNVHFFNANDGVALGDVNGGYFEIYTTTNGGTMWTRVSASNIPDHIAFTGMGSVETGRISLYAAHNNTIWFSTSAGRVYRSTDKGKTWTVSQTPLQTIGQGIAFYNQDYGYVYDGYEKLARTTDGGTTWNFVSAKGAPLNWDGSSISFVPSKPHVLITSGFNWYSDFDTRFQGLSISTDSGATWHTVQNDHNFWAGKLSFIDSKTAFAGGSRLYNGDSLVLKFTFDDIQISVTGSTTPCEGDSVMLTASSLQGYTYQWQLNETDMQSQTGMSLAAKIFGLYRMEIKSGTGCPAYSNVIAVEPVAPPQAQLVQSGEFSICPGSEFNISVDSATMLQTGLTYKWYRNGRALPDTISSITASDSGRYYVNVSSDRGCNSNSNTNTIKLHPAANVQLTFPGSASRCVGDSVILTATAGLSDYSWMRDTTTLGSTAQQFIVKTNGAYKVMAYNQFGCSGTSSPASITFNPYPAKPVISRASSGNALQCNPAASAYQWYFNDTLINGATQQTYPASEEGIYKVEVANAAGCKTMSDTFNFVLSGTFELSSLSNIYVYPNPSSGMVTLNNENTVRIKAIVFDINGRVVNEFSVDAESSSQMDYSGLRDGLYMMHITSEKGMQNMRLIIAK